MLLHTVYHPGGDEPLPTVVAIHGHGANGMDLLGLGPYLADGRALLVCPQAEFELQPGALSFTWFHTEPGARRTAEEFERVSRVLEQFVAEIVPRTGGDPSRTVILGFSQGGGLAYRLGLAASSRYRGVAALSTSLPDEVDETLVRADADAIPLLVQHGSADPVVGVERGREARDRLNALGARPDYREYPMAHEIRPDSLIDLSRWLEQVLDLA